MSAFTQRLCSWHIHWPQAERLSYAIIIFFGVAMLLTLRGSILHQLLCIQLGPMHLRTGKGPAGTLNANGSLDDF